MSNRPRDYRKPFPNSNDREHNNSSRFDSRNAPERTERREDRKFPEKPMFKRDDPQTVKKSSNSRERKAPRDSRPQRDFKGDFKRDFKGDYNRDFKKDFNRDFKKDFSRDLNKDNRDSRGGRDMKDNRDYKGVYKERSFDQGKDKGKDGQSLDSKREIKTKNFNFLIVLPKNYFRYIDDNYEKVFEDVNN